MSQNTCKASFTISKELLDFISYYAKTHGGISRSSVVQKAIKRLRSEELAMAYKEANLEIDQDFDICSSDGLNEER